MEAQRKIPLHRIIEQARQREIEFGMQRERHPDQSRDGERKRETGAVHAARCAACGLDNMDTGLAEQRPQGKPR